STLRTRSGDSWSAAIVRRALSARSVLVLRSAAPSPTTFAITARKPALRSPCGPFRAGGRGKGRGPGVVDTVRKGRRGAGGAGVGRRTGSGAGGRRPLRGHAVRERGGAAGSRDGATHPDRVTDATTGGPHAAWDGAAARARDGTARGVAAHPPRERGALGGPGHRPDTLPGSRERGHGSGRRAHPDRRRTRPWAGRMPRGTARSARGAEPGRRPGPRRTSRRTRTA